MIATKKTARILSKEKSGGAQPAKAMGEAMDCSHNPKGKNCPVHGMDACPSLDQSDERTRFGKETEY